MDDLDRQIINRLQQGFPICEYPFQAVIDTADCEDSECTESDLITRLQLLLDDGVLTRFGPLFHAEQLGGALSLCALAVPEERFDEVADRVNAFPEVAHNYARAHKLNMWFVLATETAEALRQTISQIEQETGLEVFDFPKLEEFYVGLHFHV